MLDRQKPFAMVLFCLLAVSLVALPAPAADRAESSGGIPVLVFGPQGFQRTTGAPNVFQQTFAATEETGQLELFNGGSTRGNQVTSAWVVLNGTQVFGPDDFKKAAPFLQAPVALRAQNALKITLASGPGSTIVVRVTEKAPFEERGSGVLKADLAVSNLLLTPDRCSPGTSVSLRATVRNFGPEDSDASTLVLGIDDATIAEIALDPLAAQASVSREIQWTAAGPGRHEAWASVRPGPDTMDPSAGNNSRFAFVRVSGGSPPVPELEFGPPQFDPGPPQGVAATRPPGRQSESDDLCEGWDCPALIPALPAGTSTMVQFPWYFETSGQYVVQLRAEHLAAPVPLEERIATWDLVFPGPSRVALGPFWTSMGPYRLDEPKTGPNTGRIESLAIHPQDPNVIYAAAANYGDVVSGAGLWKTADGGQQWKPLADKLPQMNITAVAVDPVDPDVVYCASGAWGFDTPVPVAPGLPAPTTGYIFKSLDGGNSWTVFAHPADGYRKLVLRRQSTSPKVVIYAASNRGVLRYTSDDPLALLSQESEWPVILPGKIYGLVVDPQNPSIVFAVRYTGPCSVATGVCHVQLDALYWTSTGLTAQGFQDWPNDFRFINPEPDQFMAVDLFQSNPQKAYLLAGDLRNGFNLLIRDKPGSDFKPAYSFPVPLPYGNPKLPCGVMFLRAHPAVSNRLYVGCTVGTLVRLDTQNGAWYTTDVPNLHMDQHAMEFFPDGASSGGWSFLVGNDGGVYRGTYVHIADTTWENTSPINNGLVSSEFYAAGFDACAADPDAMIGGMQDNGVIIYQPNSNPFGVWKADVETFGDGTAAVVAPTDPKTMYAKPNSGKNMHMKRSQDGGQSWQTPSFQNLIEGDKGSYIFTDPVSASTVYFGGSQLQRSKDGADSWEQLGPLDPKKKGAITRVVAGPATLWAPGLYAGTDLHGQVWGFYQVPYGSPWVLLDEHPDPASYVIGMALAPTDPNTLFVAYGNSTVDKRVARFDFWVNGVTRTWGAAKRPAIHATTNTEVEIFTLAVHPSNESTVFLGTDKGVYRGAVSESGWTWTPYNNGLPLVKINKLLSLPLTGEIRAGTAGRGAWTLQTSWYPGPG